jgi:DNA mismatch repair protein MutL
MGKIKTLPPEVVAKIAAGEVVERPASVVKELLENALDAGSGSVKVEVQGGGRKLIRVTDDGEGMTAEEALLSLKRYTTSKIDSIEDLFALRSFGFRGEALSSIAAVSRMKVVSRKGEEISGVEIILEAGVSPASKETGCPPGTSVEVRDLFFNVPARLKFLKSPGTELSHIGDILAKTALAHPRTRFHLFHDGKLLANFPLREDPSARLVEALGKDVAGKMFSFQYRQGELNVHGFAGEPGLTRSNSRGIYLFVNRRPVRDRLLNHAVMEGFRNLIPKDRYPVAVLFVEAPSSEVDVNVHPSKWEVKFSDSETVHRSVIRAIRGMLEETPWLKTPEQNRGAGVLREASGAYLPREQEASFLHSWPGSFREKGRKEGVEDLVDSHAPISFLGQIRETYLVFSSPEGLILLDQHAAHERIMLEKVSEDFSRGRVSSQSLLLPEVIELTPAEAKITEEHLADLARVGFDLEPSGVRTFWIRSIPQILAEEEPLNALREMIKEIASWGEGADLERSFDPLLKMLACRGAIQANRPMGREEAHALLSGLQKCRFPSHCPHGRPTMLKITYSDLGKMFGRK